MLVFHRGTFGGDTGGCAPLTRGPVRGGIHGVCVFSPHLFWTQSISTFRYIFDVSSGVTPEEGNTETFFAWRNSMAPLVRLNWQ